MNLNIITYAYRGLVSTILFIIGKKSKIKDIFAWDEEDRSINVDMSNLNSGSSTNNESFVDANAATQAKLDEHLRQEKQKFRLYRVTNIVYKNFKKGEITLKLIYKN